MLSEAKHLALVWNQELRFFAALRMTNPGGFFITLLSVFFPNRMQEIFAVARRAGENAFVVGDSVKPQFAKFPLNSLDGLGVKRGVAHHASRADFGAAQLELRFDEQQQVGARDEERRERGKNQGRRDEGDIHGGDVGARGNLLGLQITRVGFFEHRYAPVRSEEHTSELQSLTNLVCRLL